MAQSSVCLRFNEKGLGDEKRGSKLTGFTNKPWLLCQGRSPILCVFPKGAASEIPRNDREGARQGSANREIILAFHDFLG